MNVNMDMADESRLPNGTTASESHTQTQTQTQQGRAHQSTFRPADYPRKRVSVACEVCRLRKTRCDATHPSCSFCANLGVACVYRKPGHYYPTPRQSRKQVSLPSSRSELLSLLERVRIALQTMPGGSETRTSPFTNSSPRSLPDQAQRRLSTTTAVEDLSPEYLGGAGDSPFIGTTLRGFARMTKQPCAPPLIPMLQGDGEAYLEREFTYEAILFRKDPISKPLQVDVSFRTSWKYQQSFVQNILTWFPLFDQQSCAQLTKDVIDNNLDPINSSTSLVLFIFALGAYTRAQDTFDLESIEQTPGLGYFQSGCQLLSCLSDETCSVTIAHCYILKSLYLLLCLRHLAAFDSIHRSSTIIVRLLSLTTRLADDHVFRESCHRIYWICYIVEHEIRSCVYSGSQLLQPFQGFMPLLLSDDHEPGFFWFLSEIALRQIFINGLCGIGHDGRTVYAPRVSQELLAQLQQWYLHLPPGVKFNLGTDPLLDIQKAFLRSQYYAALFQVYWPYVVQFLTCPLEIPHNSETVMMLEAIKKAIEYAVLYLNSVEVLLQDRFIMIFTVHNCIFALSMALLCIFDTPDILPLHDVESTIGSIYRARQMMEPWAKVDLVIRANMTRLDDLMHLKGAFPRDTGGNVAVINTR